MTKKIEFKGVEILGCTSCHSRRAAPPTHMVNGVVNVNRNDTGTLWLKFQTGAAGHAYLGSLPDGEEQGDLAVSGYDNDITSIATIKGCSGGPDIWTWELMVVTMPR